MDTASQVMALLGELAEDPARGLLYVLFERGEVWPIHGDAIAIPVAERRSSDRRVGRVEKELRWPDGSGVKIVKIVKVDDTGMRKAGEDELKSILSEVCDVTYKFLPNEKSD